MNAEILQELLKVVSAIVDIYENGHLEQTVRRTLGLQSGEKQ